MSRVILYVAWAGMPAAVVVDQPGARTVSKHFDGYGLAFRANVTAKAYAQAEAKRLGVEVEVKRT